MTNNTPRAPSGEFVLFQAADGTTRFEFETLWLTQAAMADLYQIRPQAITQHIKAVYKEELDQHSTCKPYLQVGIEGEHMVNLQKFHFSGSNTKHGNSFNKDFSVD